MSAIKLENISKSYHRPILKDFSLSIEAGERLALYGESGSGKTTLLRLICALEKADGGKVEVNGKVSVAFQEPRLFDSFSVLENITCVGASKEDALLLFERAGLTECADMKPGELSGGMRQRASVVRALAYEADIYLFDEPLKELDAENKKALAALICERTKNKTIIAVLHDEADSALLSCNRAVSIERIS